MFDKEYAFRGKHASMVSNLTLPLGKNNTKLFDRVVDAYIMAPLVGFLYSRKSELDKSEGDKKIFLDQLVKSEKTLWFSYRLIMLLDKKHEPDLQGRIDKAFRNYGSEKAMMDEALYEEYVRGGIEVLHEKLIDPAKTEDDYLENLFNFIEDVNDRYNQEIDNDLISELCKLARI